MEGSPRVHADEEPRGELLLGSLNAHFESRCWTGFRPETGRSASARSALGNSRSSNRPPPRVASSAGGPPPTVRREQDVHAAQTNKTPMTAAGSTTKTTNAIATAMSIAAEFPAAATVKPRIGAADDASVLGDR